MKKSTLDKAIVEARRFLEIAERCSRTGGGYPSLGSGFVFHGGPQPAAVKRASMDLARALADLRQGR